MKKAIVLLMTIGFIALITALVLISLTISKKSFDEVVYLDARNQFNIVFKDFLGSVKNFTKLFDKNPSLLENLPCFPPLEEKKSGISIGICLESKMGKLNLNYLLYGIVTDVNGTKTEDFEKPLINYFSNYQLKEPRLLLDILLDTVDEDDVERGSYSEIAAEDFDFTQGKVYSYNHLKKIFDRYYKASYDVTIYTIDQEKWEEVFYFGDTNSSHQLLDCNQLSETPVVNLLTDNRYPNYEEMDFCKEFNSTEPYFKNLKKLYNIKSFDKNSQYLIQCTITFNSENFNRNVKFDYDLKTGKVENIDKNFQE